MSVNSVSDSVASLGIQNGTAQARSTGEAFSAGLRIDEMFAEIYSKLGLKSPAEWSLKRGPGAEIDREIQNLKLAVRDLQEQLREQSSVRLRTMEKHEIGASSVNEGAQSPTLPIVRPPPHYGSDKLNRAIEKTLEGTQEALKEAIIKGEKHLEDSLRQTQDVLMESVTSVIDQILHGQGIPSHPSDKTPESPRSQRTEDC